MTEYTTSSEAIREYLTARERTAHWVNQHFRHDDDDETMLSPSVPPSELDDSDAPSYGPSDSDEESSHSLPPRMILRWNDGRPDKPIPSDPRFSQLRPRSNRDASMPMGPPHSSSTVRPPQHISHNASASGTAVPPQRPRWEQTLSYVTAHQEEPSMGAQISPPRSPEHIVVLPSPQEEDPPQAPIAAASFQAGHESHLQSRTPTMQAMPHSTQPFLSHEAQQTYESPSQHQGIIAPSPQRAYNPSHLSRHNTRSPSMVYSHSQPLPAPHGSAHFMENKPGSRVQSQLPYTYSPPAIVYAPSSRHNSSRYAPPAIVYSPPSHSHSAHREPRGPAPSITYSHSAPLPQGHNPYYPPSAPNYPSLRGAPSHLSSTVVEEEGENSGHARGRSRSHKRSVSRSHHRDGSTAEHRGRSPGGAITIPRSPTRSESRSPTPPLSDAGSRTSGSTYYVLPTPGQKVQIIQPGAPSLRTATSTTKSGHHSPHSPQSASSIKKPFFQRIFSIPKFAASIDSRGSSGSTGRKLHRRQTYATHVQQS